MQENTSFKCGTAGSGIEEVQALIWISHKCLDVPACFASDINAYKCVECSVHTCDIGSHVSLFLDFHDALLRSSLGFEDKNKHPCSSLCLYLE